VSESIESASGDVRQCVESGRCAGFTRRRKQPIDRQRNDECHERQVGKAATGGSNESEPRAEKKYKEMYNYWFVEGGREIR